MNEILPDLNAVNASCIDTKRAEMTSRPPSGFGIWSCLSPDENPDDEEDGRKAT